MGQDFPATYPIDGTRYLSAFRTDYNQMTDAMLTCFVGSSDPPVTFPCLLWADTGNGKLKQRNVADTAWIVRGDLEVDYGGCLHKSGGTMTGAINMGGYALTNLPLGSGTAPARYTDLASYVKADGSVAFTAFPTFPSATNPTLAAEGAHKKYVDETVLGGGSYTGQITMTVAPSLSQHVMRKGDVENLIDTHAHTGSAGAGPKVEGANLKATGIGDGSFLRVSSSLATWSAVTPSEIEVRDEPKLVLDLTNQYTSWTDYDFGADIDAAASAVFLYVTTSSGCYMRFRPDGSSVTNGHYVGVSARERLLVPVVSRTMEYKLIGGDPDAEVWLCGYVKKIS